MDGFQLYDKLLRYIIPSQGLEIYGYPVPEVGQSTIRRASNGERARLRDQFASSYTCTRCKKNYGVDSDGIPLASSGSCLYHTRNFDARAMEMNYACCAGDSGSVGCKFNEYHVHRGELELANFNGYVETQPKPDRDPNQHGIFALDCEMCFTPYGFELTKVTVIDHKSDVVYEKLVKPENPVLDYNTETSGIKKSDLDYVTTNLKDVQRDLLDLFSSKSLLIGHSLDSDMKALKIFHKNCIDTAQLFPHRRGLPIRKSLKIIMKEKLGVSIQDNVDSKEKASAALRLVLHKAR